MTPSEAVKILALAAAFDQRTVGEADARAWHAVLADLDFPEAQEAVRAHYAETKERLMPADIRQRVKLARRAAAEAEYRARARAELTPGDPYPVQAGVTQVVRALAEHRGKDPETAEADLEARRKARSRPCPWCKAAAWEPCVIPGVYDAEGRPQQLRARAAHPSRMETTA